MKIQVIGDLHGRQIWETLIDLTCDKIIFIGDYVDSYTITNVIIKHNLIQIIELKKKYPDKIVLLLGNHDIQYLYHPEFRCSGFRPEALIDLNQLFRENKELFQIAYQYENHLFTHAGVTKLWLKWAKQTLDRFQLKADLSNIADCINMANETSGRWMLHNVGYKRGGLRGDYGGPTWADKQETWFDAVPELIQYVGHTPVADIHDNGGCDDVGMVTYCDVLHNTNNTLITKI